jgi:hypothetical protein
MSSTNLSLHYHIVFGTNNHEPMIQQAWRGRDDNHRNQTAEEWLASVRVRRRGAVFLSKEQAIDYAMCRA